MTTNPSETCLFCRIARGEVPAHKVYEDDDFVVFHDIRPAAPVHLLLIPRRHVASMQDITPEDAGWLGRMLALAPKLALDNGCHAGREGGFRLVANSGDHGGQEIHHLHFHLLGGPRPWQASAAPAA